MQIFNKQTFIFCISDTHENLSTFIDGVDNLINTTKGSKLMDLKVLSIHNYQAIILK
jgi:hypothetical protein